MTKRVGNLNRIAGSVVVGTGIPDIQVGEVVFVGSDELIGEVIRLTEHTFTAQVYESTSGIKPGEKVIATGKKLVTEIGPGMLNRIYDGVGRNLELLVKERGPFISRGAKVSTLPRNMKWHFKPLIARGSEVKEGDIIGEVQETQMLVHKVLVPNGVNGILNKIDEGDFNVDEPIARVLSNGKEIDLTMMHEWPVRIPRPFRENGRLPLREPLITGQRVIDTFFPIAKGGAAAIPGGFGTGKTVTLHQLAKWSDAHVVVYIGCGERGNEMSEVLTEFPKLKDPRSGRPLMERTVLIANTSNMPVAAREASIYIGVTMAEYYRDQGYHVAIMADSTSRWAEALREISGRLEEMPVERGYPAYLPDKIAEFYERAGHVIAKGRPERDGSVTIIGAISPPGGDFNEPVTIHTLRFTGVFWALDTELAYSRHFPAINWLKSYSLYSESLLETIIEEYRNLVQDAKNSNWLEEAISEFPKYRSDTLRLLSIAAEVESIARVIGESALPDEQRLILLTAEILKEGFLRQSAFDEVDAFCDMQKQFLLLKMIMDFHGMAMRLIENKVPISLIREIPQISMMMRVKEDAGGPNSILRVMKETEDNLERIAVEHGFSIKEARQR
ncbi:MAG: V-type ATP synthase subunit A [Nitrososphaeria archaeon]